MVVAAILPISAFLLCFIHKVRGSRGCGNHSRVLLCFIQKVYGSHGCITYMSASYISFYTKRIVCPPLLAIYLRPTISLIPKVCMNCNYTCELLSLYTKTTRSPLYYPQPSFPIYRTSMDAPTNTPQFTTFYIKIQYQYFYCYM